MVSQEILKERREALFGRMQPESIALLSAAPKALRNGDAEYPYRQDSDFYYMTGLEDPHGIVAFVKAKGKEEAFLFVPSPDREAERWTGPWLQEKALYRLTGVHAIKSLAAFRQWFGAQCASLQTVYFFIHRRTAFEKQLFRWMRESDRRKPGVQHLQEIGPLIHEQRLIKTSEEIALIQKACDISVAAHQACMRRCRVGMREFDLETFLIEEWRRHGSRSPAYTPIVASGPHACFLHYTRNDAPLLGKQLVLIDAGAEYAHYSSDITRTFPIDGHFTREQQAIYECVLEAQKAAIDQVAPGVPWDRLQSTVVEVLTEGLVALGILKGSRETLIEQKAYRPFYMHQSGHWLGLDVHDVGAYHVTESVRCLEPGMVFTVEPGLYFSEDALIPEVWRGIGVRIEDVVLVTERGKRVLSEALPREVGDVLSLVGNG